MASGGRERHSRQLPVPLAHSIAGPWTSYNVSYSRHAKKTLRYVCSRQRVRVECRESGSTSCPARLRQLARSRVYSRIEISGFDNRARGTFVSGITSRIVGRPEVETCEPESMTTIRGGCLLAQMVGAFAEFESAVLREHTKLALPRPRPRAHRQKTKAHLTAGQEIVRSSWQRYGPPSKSTGCHLGIFPVAARLQLGFNDRASLARVRSAWRRNCSRR